MKKTFWPKKPSVHWPACPCDPGHPVDCPGGSVSTDRYGVHYSAFQPSIGPESERCRGRGPSDGPGVKGPGRMRLPDEGVRPGESCSAPTTGHILRFAGISRPDAQPSEGSRTGNSWPQGRDVPQRFVRAAPLQGSCMIPSGENTTGKVVRPRAARPHSACIAQGAVCRGGFSGPVHSRAG